MFFELAKSSKKKFLSSQPPNLRSSDRPPLGGAPQTTAALLRRLERSSHASGGVTLAELRLPLHAEGDAWVDLARWASDAWMHGDGMGMDGVGVGVGMGMGWGWGWSCFVNFHHLWNGVKSELGWLGVMIFQHQKWHVSSKQQQKR